MTEAKETKRLVAATVSPLRVGQNPIWSLKTGDYGVDKMQVPDDYHGKVQLSRFFYEHEGLAYTTINKQVEIGINGLSANPGTCTEKELSIFEYVNEKIFKFLKEAALEYLLSGLVIPEITWALVPGQEINPKLRRKYFLPVDLWFRDPMSVVLRKTPLPNQLIAMVKISDDDIYFIQHKGEFKDGIEDKEAYLTLKEQYPEFVAEVNAGKDKFKLEDPTIIRRYAKSGDAYPTPYLTPSLELFMHKRNLRKMDYSIAARVIGAIQLFRLGDDEYPLTEDDDDLVEDLKKQMRWRGYTGDTERVFQLFANHTLQIDWITPDVKALLDEGKYRSINEDILTSLGIPRIIISGETLRSGSSNAEVAMLPPINTINHMRSALLEIPRIIYREIQLRNRFKGVAEPYYPPVILQSIKELIELGKLYYENGVISRTGWAEMGNVNFATELERMALERNRMDELGIDPYPDIPFDKKNEGKPEVSPEGENEE